MFGPKLLRSGVIQTAVARSTRKIHVQIAKQCVCGSFSGRNNWQKDETISLVNRVEVFPANSKRGCQLTIDSPRISNVEAQIVLHVVAVCSSSGNKSGGLAGRIQGLRFGRDKARECRQYALGAIAV